MSHNTFQIHSSRSARPTKHQRIVHQSVLSRKRHLCSLGDKPQLWLPIPISILLVGLLPHNWETGHVAHNIHLSRQEFSEVPSAGLRLGWSVRQAQLLAQARVELGLV